MVRSFGFQKFMMAIMQKNKKFWMAAHAQPQEVSPDKTLRSGRRWSKSEKSKSGTGESAETPLGANCGQHTTVNRMFLLKNLWENKKFWMTMLRT